MLRHALGLARRAVAAGLVLGLTAWLGGCAGMQSHEGGRDRAEAAQPKEEAAPEAAPAASKRFEEPGELDKLLDAKPIALAAVKPAAAPGAPAAAVKAAPEPAAAKGKGNFRIQVGAESDVDAAQAKKAEYEKLLGGTVDVVFDAPYYKLRWGYFETKQDAEDKILELTDYKIQGFVVKQ